MSHSISRSLSHRPTGPKGRVVVISHWLAFSEFAVALGIKHEAIEMNKDRLDKLQANYK